MNAHALGILEFPRLLALVASRAHSSPGAHAVRALEPRTDREWIEAEQARVMALRSLIESDAGWRALAIPDLAVSLQRLRVEGHAWSAQDLLAGAQLLYASRTTREALRDGRYPAVSLALLRPFADALIGLPAQEAAITRAIADDASVRDDASPLLLRVRRDLRRMEGELVRLLEREMAKLEPHHQASDLSVTMRNGRWVMPMRRGARGYVGGIVHDTSSTGETVFVEPPAAVEFGNRVRELELEEQREVERVLRELTDGLRPHHEELRAAFHALVALDSLYARARYAIDVRAAVVTFRAAHEGFAIVDGRHPLLLARGIPVVPFDLAMDAQERTLLVSGPNTGGKTVLLKALGLLTMMAQAGIPAPVGATTSLPIFDDVFADVGDEQSLEASLSTFSAHLKNLGEVLRHATSHSLVLIDELGSGTDPAEGAALGGAILETLTQRGALTVATTHLGQLKLLATDVPGVVNASLQFDAVELAPSYRLIKGIPGRSYGINIARRLQLPEAVVARAEERLPAGERDVAILLTDLEAREALVAERERVAAVELEKMRSRVATVTDRERKVRDREREIERDARREARRYLLEARAQVEQAIQEMRAAAQQADTVDASARAARRAIEDAAAAQGEAVARVDERAARETRRQAERSGSARVEHASQTITERAGTDHSAPPRPAALRVGDAVLVATLGDKAGRVVALKGTEARVLVGSLTVSVPVDTLRRTQAPPPPAIRVPVYSAIPEAEPIREVDVRGLRVDEVEDRVVQALDAAVRADMRDLRIIHGKGTGALRARVSEMLTKDTRVASFRLGAWNEGGAGVTVAEFS